MSTGPEQITTATAGFRFRYAFGSGYWISPNNYAFRVNSTHIAAICDYPEHFGLDVEQVRKLFDDADEPWRSEGEARKQIIIRLIQDGGWIRVREYRRGWTVNIPRLSSTSVARVRGFFLAFAEPDVPNNNVVLDHRGGRLSSIVNDLIVGDIEHLDSLGFDHEPILPAVVSRTCDVPLDGISRLDLGVE